MIFGGLGIATIIGTAGAYFAKVLASGVIKAIIWKAFLTLLFVYVLPKVFKYVFLDGSTLIASKMLDAIESFVGPIFPDIILIDFTGVGGYLAGQLQIVEAFTILFSCAFAAFTISLVKSGISKFSGAPSP